MATARNGSPSRGHFRNRGLTVAAGLLISLATAGPFGDCLFAQSIFGGEVGGRVLDEAGYPIRGAAVTLSLAEAGGGAGLVERTREDGVFAFAYAPGGVYDMRVEALGYRPVLVLAVDVAPGGHLQVPVVLVAEPPPVVRQDTILWVASGQATPTMGRAVGEVDLDGLPDRTRDAVGILAVSSWADRAGGLEGLPPGFTTLFSEGEPFRPAAHPAFPSTGEPFGILFPRVGLQSANVITGLEDIEWSGTAGGILSLDSRASAARTSGEIFGLWSGGPVWDNEVVGKGPTMNSGWGGGSFSFPFAENASSVTVNIEGGVVETPNLFWRDDYFTGALAGDALDPGTRTSGYGAGSGRVDFRVGREGRATVRGGFSTFRNQSDRPGTPQAGYGVELPGEGTDGSLAAVVAYPIGQFTLLEVKGSAGFSSRAWEPEPEALPGALLVSDRAMLGTNPSYPATSDRVDLSIAPVLHYRSGVNRMKAGFRADYGFFDLTHADQSAGAFFFGSRRALTSGQGAAILLPDGVPSEDFRILRTSFFGQYRWTARPGMDITTGISYKLERLPMEDITPALEWAQLTGVSNVSRDANLSGLDGRIHLRWDLRGDGETWVLGGMALEHGASDVTAMHEVLTLDGSVSVERALGSGLDWEQGSVSGGEVVRGTRLAMFGPDLEAPVTTRGALGIYRNLRGGVRIGVSGVYRRTESILRRTDLNRLLEPVGTDQNGRPVYGDLRIVSGVLSADPATNRRFRGFESVWALNADGWSDYRGITASIEAPVEGGGRIALHYTFSQTRDNWVGASQGDALSRYGADLPVEDWDEAVSDFDIPHRLSALVVVPLPFLGSSYLSGLYAFRSDRPFTARVASGLDANGDGSPFNDVAFVPAAGPEIQALAADWDCIGDALGAFAERNACRGDPIHTVDLRLSLGLPPIGGMSSAIVVDGLNLTDNDMGIRDDNLLLLGGGTVTNVDGQLNVPYKVNPGFGNWVFRGDTGRMLRVGLRIGGGR